MKNILLSMLAMAAITASANVSITATETGLASSQATAAPAQTLLTKRAPAKAITSANDLIGGYEFSWSQTRTIPTDGSAPVATATGKTYIEIAADDATDSLVIRGLYTYDIKAAYNAEYNALIMKDQINLNHSTYGLCKLVAMYYDADDAKTYFTNEPFLTIAENGDIYIPDGYFFTSLILTGTYANYNLVPYLYGGPMVKNEAIGVLENKLTDGTTYRGYVELSETEDYVVKANGFMGVDGTVIDIVLGENGTLTIPSQVVWAAGEQYGDFCTYPTDWTASTTSMSDCITGDDIEGTATEDVLSWGSWVAFAKSSNYYYTGSNSTSSTLKYVSADKKFRLPAATAIKDVNTDKAVKSVKYVNLAGQQSNMPFDGVNIVINTYSDGTTSASKVIK